MKYISFSIENFKGIKKLELDLDKLPNSNIFTLVGLNESGKTSILEAINLLQNKVSKEKAHKMIHKSKQYNFNDKIKIKAILQLDEQDEIKIADSLSGKFILKEKIDKITITKSYSFENSKNLNSEGEQLFESLWNINLTGIKTNKAKKNVNLLVKDRSLWNKTVKYIESNLFPRILYYENFLFSFPEKIYLKEELDNISDEEINTQKEYRKVLQDILDSLNDNLKINEHILTRLENNNDDDIQALDSIIGKIGDKLTKAIFIESWEKIFGKEKKEIILKTGKDDKEGFFIEIKIKQGSDLFKISERSLGFRWFFSFLLFTEFRKERNEELGETLFLLDEPASNLHQKAQQKLLGVFEKLTNKSKLIYSTHSHHLINPKYLSGTYIIKNNAINYDDDENYTQKETDIDAILYKNFVSNHPKEKDYFQPILDSIDYSPSELEQVPQIICLEGKFDYYTFKWIETIFFKGKYNFNYYPGASVTKFAEHFRLYLSWNKKFIAIFDSDIAGLKQQSKYINDISIELKDKIFTLSDINGSWKNFTTESLFTEKEKIKIIQNLWPKELTFNKSKFNTSIQDLYINPNNISLNKTTLKKFEDIFKFIKEKFN